MSLTGKRVNHYNPFMVHCSPCHSTKYDFAAGRFRSMDILLSRPSTTSYRKQMATKGVHLGWIHRSR
jgi:hypothetical protein